MTERYQPIHVFPSPFGSLDIVDLSGAYPRGDHHLTTDDLSSILETHGQMEVAVRQRDLSIFEIFPPQQPARYEQLSTFLGVEIDFPQR